jgi:hypothetical protein
VLKQGSSVEEMNQVFTEREAATDAKVKQLLGDEGFAHYKEYTTHLASYISAEQFKSLMLTGEKDAKEAQAKKLYDLMQQERAATLASRGLPPDYQLIPTLNFRNFASEEEGERNLALLDAVYAQVHARAGSFLTPEELDKFAEFRKMAINNNRVALAVNRKLMAPDGAQ